jgi:hypothetical protein
LTYRFLSPCVTASVTQDANRPNESKRLKRSVPGATGTVGHQITAEGVACGLLINRNIAITVGRTDHPTQGV